jgi:hypothetical protein
MTVRATCASCPTCRRPWSKHKHFHQDSLNKTTLRLGRSYIGCSKYIIYFWVFKRRKQKHDVHRIFQWELSACEASTLLALRQVLILCNFLCDWKNSQSIILCCMKRVLNRSCKANKRAARCTTQQYSLFGVHSQISNWISPTLNVIHLFSSVTSEHSARKLWTKGIDAKNSKVIDHNEFLALLKMRQSEQRQ